MLRQPRPVNALLPVEVQEGPGIVQVSRGELTSAPVTIQVKRAAPGLFLLDPENRRYVIATHADGSLVGKTSLYPGPARPLAPGRSSCCGEPVAAPLHPRRPQVNHSPPRHTWLPSKACFSKASTITDNFRLDSVVGPLGGIVAACVRVAAPPRVDIKTSGLLCYDACGPH
jgi:hypothetical protein